jgi:hypothetical protein
MFSESAGCACTPAAGAFVAGAFAGTARPGKAKAGVTHSVVREGAAANSVVAATPFAPLTEAARSALEPDRAEPGPP